MHKLALLISVVVLTGCSRAHEPRIVESNPRSYSVCYYTPRTPYEFMAAEAQYHCQLFGRSAVRVGTRNCGVASSEVTWQCAQ
jgi:hypothetical protein